MQYSLLQPAAPCVSSTGRALAGLLTSYHITSTTQPNLSASIWVALDLRPVFLPLGFEEVAGECARGDPSILAGGNR